jgi:MFS family permease
MLSLLTILLTLYVLHLGHGVAVLGLVISAQGVFQVFLRVFGGVVSDRLGERITLAFSFAAMGIAAIVFMVSSSLWALVIGQLFVGASRAVYWSAAQSYASRSQEGRLGGTLGRQFSFEAGGGLIAVVAGGIAAETLGYPVSFRIGACFALLGLVLIRIMPPIARADQARSFRAAIAPVPGLLFAQRLRMAELLAFLSGGASALTLSIHVAFFDEAGYGESWIGVLRMLTALGVVVVSFPFGMVLKFVGTNRLAILALLTTGTLIITTALMPDIRLVWIPALVATGAGFGSLRALYPTMVANSSSQGQRAVALATVGLFWASGMWIIPFAFGLLASSIGISESMLVAGIILIGFGLITPALFRIWPPRSIDED